MQVRNHHDLWSGVMFGSFGLLFIVLSRQYQLGSAAKMGPGYFPTMLGALCLILGLVIAAGAFRSSATQARIAKVGWRELIVVLLGVSLFAALLPQLGIIVALIVLILVTSTASHEFRFRDALISSVVLLIMSYLVFVKGLELQFPLLPKFMTK
ncbi:MAG: tripartite tricarboxylate transporter TctB family protein [Burkholderiales bacterium]|nr:tripartite tricarboxylate transporter TctB family protein [Burkholderiales bacterium]